MPWLTRSRRFGSLLATGLALVAGLARAQTVISVNFGESADYPLLKDKFNLYDTSLPSTAELERDLPLLEMLNVESMRLEQAWGYGQTLSNTIGGTKDNLTFDFAAADRWQKLITSKDVLIHWSYDYTPKALSGKSGDVPAEPWWTQCVQKTWQHLHDVGDPVLLHEVWNEPDFPALGFFTGSEQDYYALYARTAKKLRELDKDAKIAGPTTAYPFWLSAFADYVKDQKLPLDALTFHQYTRLGDNDHIAQAAGALSRYPEFDTVEMVMDEYHPYNPWPKDGWQQTFQGATDLLYETIRLGKRTELTSLNWAQFQEPGHNTDQYLGLITADGHPKASFNALRLYGMLPVDSVARTVTGAALDVMASADQHRAGIVVLNRTSAEEIVKVTLAAPPFAQGKVQTYRIDAEHNSYLNGKGEQLTASDMQSDVPLAAWEFSGKVPSMGTLAFLFDDGSGLVPKKSLPLGKIVRVNRYYPSRKTSAYADFDRRTFVARLGMVNEMQADKEVGVTVESLPPVLHFQTKVSGSPKKIDKNTVLGVRVDFQVGDAYVKSTLFYGSANGVALYDAARDQRMPFGTARQADEVVAVADFADFSVKLADHAPPGATGRVQLTYLMQNTGTGSRAVITTTSADVITNPGGSGGAAAGGVVEMNGGASSAAGATAVGGTVNGAGGVANGGALAAAGTPSGGVTGAVAGDPNSTESSCTCSVPPRVSRAREWLGWVVAGAAWVGLRQRRRG
jgi:xylan 1,4-beta-xylosidase